MLEAGEDMRIQRLKDPGEFRWDEAIHEIGVSHRSESLGCPMCPESIEVQ